MKSQLLCTFTTKENLDSAIKEISDAYTIVFDKIYVLQNEDDIKELICTYNVDTTESVDYNKVKEPTGHSILFGLGAKLPTGKFEQRLANAVNPGFQVGTGSLDGIFSLGYNYGSDKFGLNTLVTYYLKTENKNDYQFGNQISINTKAFTAIKTSKMNIMPFVGFSYDNFDDIILLL